MHSKWVETTDMSRDSTFASMCERNNRVSIRWWHKIYACREGTLVFSAHMLCTETLLAHSPLFSLDEDIYRGKATCVITIKESVWWQSLHSLCTKLCCLKSPTFHYHKILMSWPACNADIRRNSSWKCWIFQLIITINLSFLLLAQIQYSKVRHEKM